MVLERFRQQIDQLGQRFRGSEAGAGVSAEQARAQWAQELETARSKAIGNKDLYRVVNLSPLVHLQSTTDPDTVRRELLTIAELSGPKRDVVAWTSANAAYDIASGEMILRVVPGVRENQQGQRVPTAGVERWETQGQLFDLIENYPRPAIFFLENFHLALENPEDKRAMVDIINRSWDKLRRQNKTVVILTPLGIGLPPEIGARCPVVQEVPINRTDRERIIAGMMAETGLRTSREVAERIVDATTGLNVLQTHQALQYALLTEWGLNERTAAHVSEWKQKQMAASGRWEALDTKEVPELVGWDHLEEIILQAKDYGVFASEGTPHAQSMWFLVGPPGVGKTTFVRRMGQMLGVPVYEGNVANWMGQYMGQTEQGFEAAVAQIRAAQPCIAFIDEAQRQLQSGDQHTAGGTMHRSMGSLLRSIEASRQRGERIVWVMTANTLDGVEPETIDRASVYRVPLPGPQTRVAVWHSIFNRFKAKDPRMALGADMTDEVISNLVKDYGGRKIEQLISKAVILGTGLVNLDTIEKALTHMAKGEADPDEVARRRELYERFPSVSTDVDEGFVRAKTGDKQPSFDADFLRTLNEQGLPPVVQGPMSAQEDKDRRRRTDDDSGGLISIPVEID